MNCGEPEFLERAGQADKLSSTNWLSLWNGDYSSKQQKKPLLTAKSGEVGRFFTGN